MGQGRRQFRSGRLVPHPANLQPRPPSPHGGPPQRKTPGHPRSEGDKLEAADGASTSNAEPQSSKGGTVFKAVSRLGTLLSSGGKSAGQPPTIHPPWSKARVRPMEEGDGGRERVEKREGEGVRRAPERGVAGRREHEQGDWRERRAGRDEGAERRREVRGRETEMWVRSNRNAVAGMRNGGGEVGRGEYRGELPGFPSSHARTAGPDGGVVIDGSYFQTSAEAKKPAPAKQKLSEALSLISMSRRLQGPARVGEGERRDGKGWERGEEDRREINGSIGDMSVSAAVSERSWDSRGKEARRRAREEVGEEDRWWEREKTGIRFRDEQSDSESGSAGKRSHLDFSLSETSSPASSFMAKHDDDSSSYREREDSTGGSDEEERSKTESDSDTDTEKQETGVDSGTEGSQDGDREGSESDREGGEEEGEGESSEKSSRRSGKSSSRSSGSGGSMSDDGKSRRSKSAKKSRSGKSEETNGDSSSSRYSSSSASSVRPKTSRHARSSSCSCKKTAEEREEDEESGEEGSVNTSNNLSPIIEDTEEEEEEKSSSSEEEEGLENETAD